MASKIDKEMLKKQHFWLLLIPVVLGLLLAWIGLFVGVADATEEKQKANNDAKAEVERAAAQSKAVLKLYDERKEQLFQLRTKRWKEMWDLQKDVYEWPKELGEDQVAKVKDMKFGTEISDPSFLNAFRDRYAKEYDSLVAEVAPLQFSSSWYAVLAPVLKWTRNPESEDVWLAAEDFWVKREIMRALVNVNKEAALLAPRTAEKGLRKQTFFGRTWELGLQLVEKPNGLAIEGTIKNLTPRLQPFNVTNELVFNLWLSDSPDAKPFRFAVEGTALEGGKTEPIKFVEKKHTVFEGNPRGFYRVEQVFDVRTAPVKRLDRLEVGNDNSLSDRHPKNKVELQMCPFSEKAKEAEGTANAAAPGGPGGPGLPGGPGGPGASGVGIGGGPSGPGGSLGQAAAGDNTFNGLGRRRYISRTDQVRAMPIYTMVIADQAFVQDVLTAVANCKLRFQTVQTHLARFRGSLVYTISSGTEGDAGRPGGPSGFGPSGPSFPGIPGVPGFPSGPPSGPPGPRMPNLPGMPGMPSFPGGFGGGGSARSSNEDQVASNLVEVHIYGITTLYEKFDTPDKKGDTVTETKTAPEAPTPPMTPTAPKDDKPPMPAENPKK
jgi:hypothetical protein